MGQSGSPAVRKGCIVIPTPPSPAYFPVHRAEAEARMTWVSKARCRATDPDELFVRGAAQRKAAQTLWTTGSSSESGAA
jgi:hypothetical protein